MNNLKIGNKYRIRESVGVGKDKEALRAGIYRLIDVTEKNLFVFKPTKSGKCVTYKAWELDQKIGRGEVTEA